MEFSAYLYGEQSTMAGMAAFFKTSAKEVMKSEGSSKRIEITMGITCHTCHAFSVFGLGTPFLRIATCHQTCHDLSYVLAEGAMSVHKKATDERSTT
jgi:hypothetical protein